MADAPKVRPPVPGSPTIPGHGSGLGYGGAGGAKNPRATDGCHKLTLATYNGRSLRLDESLEQLEVELRNIRWHVLGLSEVRRQGEDTTTLESGHLFYFREGDHQSQGGVGFLVNKVLRDNVLEVSSVSTRVAYLVLKLTKRYSLKVVQVYAPTSSYSDTEVEAMYEDIAKAIDNTTKTHLTVVMGDFNAKVGVRNAMNRALDHTGLDSETTGGKCWSTSWTCGGCSV